MDFQKISGWFLLITGLMILRWSIYASFNIFTVKTSSPQIFKIEEKESENQLSGKDKIPTTPDELEKEMNRIVTEEVKALIPTEIITGILNLIAWAIFASFLIFAGFQIANLGIKLIKK